MADTTVDGDLPTWQRRSLERSTRAARERAISKGHTLIRAALELMRSTGGGDFTVQEVVDRAGMSLRSFYQHFATKDDLLLALLEETTTRYLSIIRPEVDAQTSARAKLEALVRHNFLGGISEDPASRGMVLFHWHLAANHTEEFAATLRPQRELIEEILADGVAAGEFRDDLDPGAMASLVSATLVTLLDLRALGVQLGDEDVQVDDVVDWCMAAVTAP